MKKSYFFVSFFAVAFFGLVSKSYAQQDLNLEIVASREVVEPSGYSPLTVVVSNLSSNDLFGVTVSVQFPNHMETFFYNGLPNFICSGSSCSDNEVGTWTIDTLSAGRFRQITLPFQVDNNAPQSMLSINATATATNATSSPNSLTMIQVESATEMAINLVAKESTVKSGGTLTYSISVVNSSSQSPTNSQVEMVLPPNTTFNSASSGGTISGDTVTWNTGLFASGESKDYELKVSVSNSIINGELIVGKAKLNTGISATPSLSSAAISSVDNNNSLKLGMALTQKVLGQRDEVYYTLTAINSGTTDLLNVSAVLILPPQIESFFTSQLANFGCSGSSCGDYDIATWNLGTLGSGESQTLNFNIEAENNAPLSEILQINAIINSSDINTSSAAAIATSHIDISPNLQIGLSSEFDTVSNQKAISYQVSFGNLGANSLNNALLTLPVPSGTSFHSATKGGSESNGVITWQLPSITAGKGDMVQAILTIDTPFSSNQILFAEVLFEGGNSLESNNTAQDIRAVNDGSPFILEYSVSPQATIPTRACSH